MELLLETVMQSLANYIWPFFRISSMFMVMTVIGSNNTPKQIRLLLSVAVTVAVVPMLPPVAYTELFSITSFLITLQQILIGIAMGFVSLLLMQCFVLAGQIIGMQTSLGFASMVDPGSGQQTPVVGNFFLLLATMVFLAVDGHLLMVRMLIVSFETLPVSTEGIAIGAYHKLVLWGSYIFAAALTMSMSAIVALLVINLSFGVMTRAAPQLNIFAIGFPITMISGLVILWLTLETVMSHFDRIWLSAQQVICDLVRLQCTQLGGG
ncbi:flagellar biosynthetic protein FliR [Shewanella marina]|uniref:flagellar biosynthetic protein FliR n=1 Tax=Shewanella marina TaxID=487319 RepID=UPI00046F42DF|nr:flagellar biosynthetic protein FliR [Shewanella marina]